jgi:hypothetical protein
MYISLLAFLVASCQAQQNNTYYTGRSQHILDSLLSSQTFTSPTQTALNFIGYPYKSHSLEITGKEQLVVDMTGFDCVTLVENSIALYLSNGSETDYLKNLQNLRYRNGELNGYLSRLHYFTDWILNAEKSEVIENVTKELNGISYTPSVFFMSTHPELYPKLERTTQIDSLKRLEQELSKLNMSFVPKASLAPEGFGIKDGDIIAIVTSISGLDITHVGFAFRKNDNLYFLHASSQYHHVMISDDPLSVYLDHHNHMLGIVVLRMKQ